MKKFILFGGSTFYPCGGWEDYINSFAELGEAIFEARKQMKNDGFTTWAHIVCLDTNDIVWDSDKQQ